MAIPVRASRVEELRAQKWRTAVALQGAGVEGARAVIIATETGRHLPDGRAALQGGLDVLMEKPMARNAEEAGQLLAQARRAGRRLFVGCVLRFAESLATLREWLPRLGGLHAVRIECQSYLPEWRPDRPYRESYSARADDGGVLRDLIHEIDYAGWLFGWPTAVSASLANLGRLGIEAEEIADIWWQAPLGCGVSVHLDYVSRPARRRMRVSGALGMLEWDGLEHAVTWMPAHQAPQCVRSSQTRAELFSGQARAFLEACDGVAADPRLATAEEGLKALAVCDAARQASAQRREVAVEYPHVG